MQKRLLQKYITNVTLEEFPSRRLRVFDFDDTLVRTSCKVKIVDHEGNIKYLSSRQFGKYRKKHSDNIDFSQFNAVIKPKKIGWTNRVLRAVVAHHGTSGVVILTARHCQKAIHDFFKRHKQAGIKIVALGTNSPLAKAEWIAKEIYQKDLSYVEFFDDSAKNIKAVKKLKKKFKNVKFKFHHIKY